MVKFRLKQHQRIYSDVRLYPCDYCDKSFRQSGSLKRHQRIQTGVRPYPCNDCDNSFRRSSNLKRHQIVIMDRTHLNVEFGK